MLIHCVFLNLKPDASQHELVAVFKGLDALCQVLDGAKKFNAGPNVDIEMKSPDYDAGFVISFTDRAALSAYADHPTHKALGARLVALCNGGADGIMVFDLDT